MSSLAWLNELLNKDALAEGRTNFPQVFDLFTKNFWVENISDRFYSSINYVLPVLVILLCLHRSAFALSAAQSNKVWRDADLSNRKFGICLYHHFDCQIWKLNWFPPMRGYRLSLIQNEIFIKDDPVYDNYLNEWRWNLWLFFLALTSFSAPFLMGKFVLSYMIYRLPPLDRNK